MIEFAMVSTLLVTMLFGILTYGEVLAHYIQLRYAVGEISRQMAVGEDENARSATFTNLHDKMVDAFKSDAVTATCASFKITPTGAGADAKVLVEGSYQLTDACRFMPAVVPLPTSLTTLSVSNLVSVRGGV
ncbi:pilus assembly protein [Oleomonas cavernae]|uniref:Pilus assembly protein n=1 Tax=Oleomonas cavernae TaxID=2320859 RepID=A0A418WTH3_9PROT|nr:TadE family protein [Oleomonas cavernae]RJF94528.1 pilus assembly protein [Oleomonas cavernae]